MWLKLILVLLLAGCGSSGQPSTRTSSATLPTLQAKSSFLERYVAFRRTYETLDFQINYTNGNGLGPSEWDIRLVAKVPASELPGWVPPGMAPASGLPDRDWIKSVATAADLTGMTEWYVDNHRAVGIDRKQSLVAYRNWVN